MEEEVKDVRGCIFYFLELESKFFKVIEKFKKRLSLLVAS